MSYDNDITLTTTTETTLVAAGGAGVYRHLMYVHASNPTTVATNISIADGTGGTVRAIMALPALAAGVGGPVALDPPKPLAAAAANTNWTAQLGTATTVYVFAQAESTKSTAPRADSIP